MCCLVFTFSAISYEHAVSSLPLSSYSAAKAVAKTYPAMKGKLTGIAFRVPIAHVSVDPACELEKETTSEDIKAGVQLASETYAKDIVGYTVEQGASSELIGMNCSTVLDAVAGCMLTPNFADWPSQAVNGFSQHHSIFDECCQCSGKTYLSMKDKLTGMALRVPPMDVSVGPTGELEKEMAYEDIKAEVQLASETYAKDTVGYTVEQGASSEHIGMTCSTVLDAVAGFMVTPNFADWPSQAVYSFNQHHSIFDKCCQCSGKTYPSMKDKLTGMALRVPPMDVSVGPTGELEKEMTYEDIKAEVQLASEPMPRVL